MTDRNRSIVASDITGQRQARWPLEDEGAPWSAVTARAVSIFDLPVFTPYQLFEEASGELLPADERIADGLGRYPGEEIRVRVAPEMVAAAR